MMVALPMHRVVDVDIASDVTDVYPLGWAAQVGSLERGLRREGHHTVSFALGTSHTLALASDGTVYSWGWSDRGQLGHDSKAHKDEPTLIRFVEADSLRRGASWVAR